MLLCGFSLGGDLGIAKEGLGRQTLPTAAMVLPSHSPRTSQSGSSTRIPSEELLEYFLSLYPSHGHLKVL